MRFTKYKKYKSLLLLIVLIAASCTSGVKALQASSATYGVDEAFFGSGGQLNACSTTYCSNQTAGDLGVGKSSSASYQVQAGSDVTDRTPYLEFVINNTNIDLGTLTTATTATATATFYVKTYLAGGYVVQNSSPGPQNDGYTMHTLSTPTGSSIGNEQFGINLVANTNPATFGAGPNQAPDSTFSFGQVASGYNTANFYKYVDGDIVAFSNSSSGETDYTISYIYNISNVTPGGTYILKHDLVATSTY